MIFVNIIMSSSLTIVVSSSCMVAPTQLMLLALHVGSTFVLNVDASQYRALSITNHSDVHLFLGVLPLNPLDHICILSSLVC